MKEEENDEGARYEEMKETRYMSKRMPTIMNTKRKLKGQYLIGLPKEKITIEIQDKEELDKITALLEEDKQEYEVAVVM